MGSRRGMVEGLASPVPLVHRLPGVLQDDDFTQRFVSAFDDAYAPILTTLDSLWCYFDPQLAPADFVDHLAGWVGIDLDDSWSPRQRRAIVAGAALLHRRRGTRRGIEEALALGLGAVVTVTDTGGCTWSAVPGGTVPGGPPARIDVRVEVEEPDAVDPRRVESLIEATKPAHVAHTVTVVARGPRHDRGRVPDVWDPREGDEEFCRVCDTFLDWQGAAAASAPAAEPVAAPTPTPPGAPPPYQPGAVERRPPDRVRPPLVSTGTTEVTVSPEAPATFTIELRNGSTIVDAYDVLVTDPPWLAVSHGDTNLLPDETRTVGVTFAVRAGSLALAQRLPVVLLVRSNVDASHVAQVPLTVVVPRSGPPATLVAHPSLVRLADTGAGDFRLRIDNRAANYARHYVLSASDQEDVVRVGFVPPEVDVPAGGTAEVTARFTAPEPAPGEDAARQVAVTATDESGPVTVQVQIQQTKAALLVQQPLKLRLEPSQVTANDTTYARLDVVVDNRSGVQDVVVNLRGRDPAASMSFAFDHDGFTLQAGRAVRLGVQLGFQPAPPGQSATRPFTVVAVAAGSESTIDGTLELRSRPAAITSAAVRLVPDHLEVASRTGTYRVEVDNRQGQEPLGVYLSGAEEYGRARVEVKPAQLLVGPGQVGFATMTVNHPRPDGGQSQSRNVRVTATAGPVTVTDDAVFTQKVASHLRLWAILLGIVAVLLVLAGAFVQYDDIGMNTVSAVVDQLSSDAQHGDTPSEAAIRLGVTIGALGLLVVPLLMMVLGLTGTTGKGLRRGGILALLLAGAAMGALEDVTLGTGLVAGGAVLAFVSGVMVRQAGD